ncbi:hypothetical protein [uncultured Rikenella sp.]|uniref:hypothetical protein n=1 Tax=uncultured Rikenella sp. TaxID=368003 RepID=UPI0026024462|nr:hypothetical protein [uncultured Rikenella sp.]
MPAKQVKRESIARRFFEKLKSIWERVDKWHSERKSRLRPGGFVLLTPAPFSANDWIVRIVESHLTDRKCTIELERQDTELGEWVRWKCLQEGQPVFQGYLSIRLEDFEKPVRVYLDDPDNNLKCDQQDQWFVEYS